MLVNQPRHVYHSIKRHCASWNLGWDSNPRLYSFADCCNGPLCHLDIVKSTVLSNLFSSCIARLSTIQGLLKAVQASGLTIDLNIATGYDHPVWLVELAYRLATVSSRAVVRHASTTLKRLIPVKWASVYSTQTLLYIIN